MDPDSKYFVWKSADPAVVVRIGRVAMQGLNVEIMRGFGVTRRRGAEAGGILLGRLNQDTHPEFSIDDFEPVACEYAFGPSYILSAGDHERFADAMARCDGDPERTAIGYYRSHTREGLGPDQADADLFGRYFSGHGKVALIMKPFATRSASASLFFPLGGVLKAEAVAREFDFSPNAPDVLAEPLVPKPVLRPERAPPPQPIPAVAPAPMTARLTDEARVLTNVLGPRPTVVTVEEPVPEFLAPELPVSATKRDVSVGAPSRWSRALFSMLLCAAVLMFGMIAGFQLAGGRIQLQPLGFERPAGGSGYNLGMSVTKTGEKIHVHWSADSDAVVVARAGTITVEDSGMIYPLVLDPAELRGGTLLYQPRGNTVRFRLELVLPGNRSASETAVWPPAAE